MIILGGSEQMRGFVPNFGYTGKSNNYICGEKFLQQRWSDDGAAAIVSEVDHETSCICRYYPRASFYGSLFLLYYGGDRMYEVRRRKSEPTILPTQGIFNLPHYIGMV